MLTIGIVMWVTHMTTLMIGIAIPRIGIITLVIDIRRGNVRLLAGGMI